MRQIMIGIEIKVAKPITRKVQINCENYAQRHNNKKSSDQRKFSGIFGNQFGSFGHLKLRPEKF